MASHGSTAGVSLLDNFLPQSMDTLATGRTLSRAGTVNALHGTDRTYAPLAPPATAVPHVSATNTPGGTGLLQELELELAQKDSLRRDNNHLLQTLALRDETIRRLEDQVRQQSTQYAQEVEALKRTNRAVQLQSQQNQERVENLWRSLQSFQLSLPAHVNDVLVQYAPATDGGIQPSYLQAWFGALRQWIDDREQAVDREKKSSGDLHSHLNETLARVQTLERQLQTQATRLQEAQLHQDLLQKRNAELENEYQAQLSQIESLNQLLQPMVDQVAKLEALVQQRQQQLTEANTSYESERKRAEKLGNANAKLREHVVPLQKSLKQGQERIKTLESQVTELEEKNSKLAEKLEKYLGQPRRHSIAHVQASTASHPLDDFNVERHVWQAEKQLLLSRLHDKQKTLDEVLGERGDLHQLKVSLEEFYKQHEQRLKQHVRDLHQQVDHYKKEARIAEKTCEQLLRNNKSLQDTISSLLAGKPQRSADHEQLVGSQTAIKSLLQQLRETLHDKDQERAKLQASSPLRAASPTEWHAFDQSFRTHVGQLEQLEKRLSDKNTERDLEESLRAAADQVRQALQQQTPAVAPLNTHPTDPVERPRRFSQESTDTLDLIRDRGNRTERRPSPSRQRSQSRQAARALAEVDRLLAETPSDAQSNADDEAENTAEEKKPIMRSQAESEWRQKAADLLKRRTTVRPLTTRPPLQHLPLNNHDNHNQNNTAGPPSLSPNRKVAWTYREPPTSSPTRAQQPPWEPLPWRVPSPTAHLETRSNYRTFLDDASQYRPPPFEQQRARHLSNTSDVSSISEPLRRLRRIRASLGELKRQTLMDA